MTRAAAVLILLALNGVGEAQDPVRPAAPDKVDAATARAVKWLASVQTKEGAISDSHPNQIAMTSLAIMAMAATGHQPTDETPEGKAMKKALAFVLGADRQDAKGYFGGSRDAAGKAYGDGSRMYGHGIATLMLCEMLGMGVDGQMDVALRDRAKKAIDLILRSQSIPKDARSQGGWRYTPESGDSDLSITVWQVMALRSARNAGLDVPKEAIDKAIDYIKRCYKSKRDGQGKPEELKSACAYEPGQHPEYAMASAGLLSLQVCGAYDSLEVKGSADFLKEKKVEYGGEWYFYGTYYYAQGMFQRGGEHATHARKIVEETLLPKQDAQGWWLGVHGQERGAGKVYCTAMSVLSLAVKYHYLPIYQR